MKSLKDKSGNGHHLKLVGNPKLKQLKEWHNYVIVKKGNNISFFIDGKKHNIDKNTTIQIWGL